MDGRPFKEEPVDALSTLEAPPVARKTSLPKGISAQRRVSHKTESKVAGLVKSYEKIAEEEIQKRLHPVIMLTKKASTAAAEGVNKLVQKFSGKPVLT